MSAATVDVVMITVLALSVLLTALVAVLSGVANGDARQPRRGGRHHSPAVAR